VALTGRGSDGGIRDPLNATDTDPGPQLSSYPGQFDINKPMKTYGSIITYFCNIIIWLNHRKNRLQGEIAMPLATTLATF
jgi:hypothetical protein